MSHLDPIAYTYEADYHCPGCTFERFGMDDQGFVPDNATDREGNLVGAVAPWDEWWECQATFPQSLVCSTCNGVIATVTE